MASDPDFESGYTGFNTNKATPPSLAVFKGVLYCAHQDEGGKGVMLVRSPDALYWDISHRQHIGDTRTSAAPCVAAQQDTLHVFYRDGNGNGLLHVSSQDGGSWTQPAYLRHDVDGQPSAVARGDELLVVFHDGGGRKLMYLLRGADGQWRYGGTDALTRKDGSAGIAVFKGRYHMVYRDYDNDQGQGVMHVSSADGLHWEGVQHILHTQSSASPCIVADGDRLHVFYRAHDGHGVRHVYSDNGKDFHEPQFPFIGLNIDGAPVAAVLNGVLCVAGTDTGNKGVMRAVKFPPAVSRLKGWDYIVALRLDVVGPLPVLERALVLERHEGAPQARLGAGRTTPSFAVSGGGLALLFPLTAQDGHGAGLHLAVTPVLSLIPLAGERKWRMVADFTRHSSPPSLQGPHGLEDGAQAAAATELARLLTDMPPLTLATFGAPLGPGAPLFNYSEFICVKGSGAHDVILLALLSGQGKAPDYPDCRNFDAAVLPAGSDLGLYAGNGQLIQLASGMVQDILRAQMGPQGRDGTRDLSYGLRPAPQFPRRTQAYTDGNYCRFWEKKYQPSVDQSWVDTADARLILKLRLRAADVAPNTAGYVEATPALRLQLGSDPARLLLSVEEPVPSWGEAKGPFASLALNQVRDAARDLAKKLGEELSKIQPIDLGSLATFTAASINHLGELFVALKQK